MINLIIVAIICSALVRATPIASESSTTCGYDSCHKTKDGFINVHIVPHTHDDVGWLKTVDQYFYGSKTNIQSAGVQYILDSVMDALRHDPNRRFIYVETSYFWKWWIKQHDFVKHYVKKFVKNGQLEFIGGAWSMNDEATTHYQSTIDQFTWGLRFYGSTAVIILHKEHHKYRRYEGRPDLHHFFVDGDSTMAGTTVQFSMWNAMCDIWRLNDTFGACARPKIGWQIDPFGHSKEFASILAQLGYDGLMLGRIDYQDKKFKFKTKTPEMIWKGSDSLGAASNLFTSVMYNTYSPPPGFCFDILCDDEPIIDDKKSPDYNVDKRLNDLIVYLDRQIKAYATNNTLVTMGGDFTYMNANMWFKNLDKLIRYANAQQANGSKYNLLYSTPSCYIKAVHDEAITRNLTWNVKEDDFFPYASDPHAYWTGYFTSRPTIKRYERLGNNFLQVCKQLYALTDLGPEDWADLNVLREAMGVMQHHDAITGTEKQHVAYDYARLLSHGMDECNFVAATALSKLATGKKAANDDNVQSDDPAPEIPFESCMLANVSQCALTESKTKFIITVYNPLSRPVSHYVRLPVTGTAYKVTDPDGNQFDTQIIPIHDAIFNIPGRFSTAKYDLIFEATNLPPLGYKSYYVEQVPGDNVLKSQHIQTFNHSSIKIIINEATGLIYDITMNDKKIPFAQDFLYYESAIGNNEGFKNRSSGAYIFRPNGTNAFKVTDKATYKFYQGKYVAEMHQTFNDWISQTVKVYENENMIEFEWLVGPIPIDDVVGKEVISRFTTSLKSDSTFYTDSNGREMLKRVRNFRPTWKLDLAEPVAGNYYPVTSKILIRDQNDDVEVAVLTDRAQGGASLSDGEMELMVHRRCLHDDAFGVGESLNETAFGKGLVVRGKHYVISGPYLNKSDLVYYERDLAQRRILESWVFVSDSFNLSYKDYKAKYRMMVSGLKQGLPENVQILTLEPWIGMDFLLRLEHVYAKNEHATLSQPATINLKNLFTTFNIKSVRETNLGANQWLKDEDNDRLMFKKSGNKLEDLVDYYESYQPSNEKRDSDWDAGRDAWKNDQFDSNDVHHNAIKNKLTVVNNTPDEDDKFNVVLNPMQIRTFVIEISPSM